MSKPERIRRCRFSVCWLAAILAIPVLLTGQEWRQLQREKALIDSIPHRDTPAALELLAQGVNPNTCQSAQSKPPGLLQALRLLLHLQKPPAQTGLPVLMLAAQQGNDTVMRALMAKGANVNVADEKGGTPLMWAIAKHDDPATVQKFLERGANVKASKPGGTTVLMCAIVKHDATLVRELLNRGGDASQPAHYGHEDWMPLAQAYEEQQGALVDLLLAHGADPNATIGGHVDPHCPRMPSVIGIARNDVTTLDTSADIAFKACYSRSAPFDLDSMQGYDLGFDLKVIAETHGSREDRAGCDVIVLGSDGRGVELAFWTNAVWAQADRLVHATGTESHAFDTTAARRHYVLHVASGKYTLSAGEGTAKTNLLSGSLHSYAASGPALPYRLKNYIFIGDDTTSASAVFQIAHIAVSGPPKTGTRKGLH